MDAERVAHEARAYAERLEYGVNDSICDDLRKEDSVFHAFGLSPDADKDAITKRYKLLPLKTHPDKASTVEGAGTEEMQTLSRNRDELAKIYDKRAKSKLDYTKVRKLCGIKPLDRTERVALPSTPAAAAAAAAVAEEKADEMD